MSHKYCRFFIIIGALFVCFIAFSASAADDNYVIVEAEGIGADRASAMDNAWLEGVRQAAGSFIDSKTELNNDELTERIISYSRGLVEKYEVLGVDDSRAGEGIYKLKLRMWVVRDILRDSAEHATAGSAEVSFSLRDIKRQQKDDIDAKALESRDAAAETAKRKAQTAPELLSAMLERYKPEDFLSCRIQGLPEAVKGQQDKFRLNVEITFNEKLYKEAFIPDLIQVLDQIATSKKSITLTKQRDQLRKLADKNGLPTADTSIICRETGLGSEYQLAVYDRPNRFGCRLYGFSDEDRESILRGRGVLDQFCGRTNRVRGLILELIDENKEVIDSVEIDISLPFLISNNLLTYQHWAIHPTIMRYEAMLNFLPLYTEGSSLVFPVVFDLPEEFIEDVRSIRASVRLDERFAEAGINTRISLNNSVHGYFKGAYKEHEKYFKAESDKGYPLAKVALETVNMDHILGTSNQLLDETIRRLTPMIENGNIDAVYQVARSLEGSPNYETQKRCVQYYIKAAEKNPLAMIRLGEVYEQGFYDVPVDKEKANALYAKGLRLLFILTHHGHPNAAAALGRAALEGLGMEHYAHLAEQCYVIAKSAGYEDPEFWLWENYGIAMRRITMPSDMKTKLNFGNMKTKLNFGNMKTKLNFGNMKTKLNFGNNRGFMRFKSESGIRVDNGGMDSNAFFGVVSDALANPRTCIYLVRDKLSMIYLSVQTHGYNPYDAHLGLINRTTDGLAFQLLNAELTSAGNKVDGLSKGHYPLLFAGVVNRSAKDPLEYWGYLRKFEFKSKK